jgi:hypothetical protein
MVTAFVTGLCQRLSKSEAFAAGRGGRLRYVRENTVKFVKYEKKLTNMGDREATHAVFQIGSLPNPFGEGHGLLLLNYTKAGLEERINTMKGDNDNRLVMLDILFNWPDDEP